MNEPNASPPQNIGVTFNPLHDGARELAIQVVDAIRKRGVAVALDDETSAADELSKSDLVICLGGDGSVLRCTRRVVERGRPFSASTSAASASSRRWMAPRSSTALTM